LDETNWQKQLLIGVVMLLVVGGLIGVVLAVAGLKAAKLAGIGDTKQTTPTNERLHIPRNVASSTPGASSAQAGQSSSLPTTSHRPSAAPLHLISLQVSPSAVGSFEHINLSGSYRAPDGTRLQVQRKENGVWSDFPTTTSVTGGAFATYVETAHTGLNLFRVSDVAHGRSSNVVKVTVR
jgi:hypothetical protein